MLLFSSTALPAITKLADCADVSKTITPYLPQLQTFPQQVWDHISDVDALKQLYISTNPLVISLSIAFALAPLFLVISEFNKNYSQVDRVWSILPPMYIGHYTLWAHLNGLPTQRLDNALAFATIWGLRLTFNYWRRGGYSIGSEDYRWEIVKNRIGYFPMLFFNITFISLAQSILLWSITTPTYILLLASKFQTEMNTTDIIFTRILIALVLWEFFSDQQQWNYQEAKRKYQASAKVPPTFNRAELDRGFVSSGLWSISRHPNFLAEQAIWVTFYQWSCTSTDVYYNYAGLAAASYLFLFQASTWLTELVTAGKYPDYKIYQERVGRFIPKLNFINTLPFPDDPIEQPPKTNTPKQAIGNGAGKSSEKKGKKK